MLGYGLYSQSFLCTVDIFMHASALVSRSSGLWVSQQSYRHCPVKTQVTSGEQGRSCGEWHEHSPHGPWMTSPRASKTGMGWDFLNCQHSRFPLAMSPCIGPWLLLIEEVVGPLLANGVSFDISCSCCVPRRLTADLTLPDLTTILTFCLHHVNRPVT